MYLRTVGGKSGIAAKAEWNRAGAYESDRYVVVEADLMMKGFMMFLDPACEEMYVRTQDPRYRQSYTRVVVQTDLDTDETLGFLMTVVPNLEWMERSNFEPFAGVTFLDRGEEFSGRILFHHMDGSFSNGWMYERGRITGRIGVPNTTGGILTRARTCWQDQTLHMWMTCKSWTISVGGLPPKSGVDCEWEYSKNTEPIEVCVDDGMDDEDEWGGGGGGYIPPDTPGGGGSNPPTDPIKIDPLAPKASRIFNFADSRLTDQQKQKVEDMVEEIMADCMGSMLYGALASKQDPIRIEFVNFTGNEAAQYLFNAWKIEFKPTSGSSTLLHELMHAYQDMRYGVVNASKMFANLETEAYLAQYRSFGEAGVANVEFKYDVIALNWYLRKDGTLRNPDKSDKFNQKFERAALKIEQAYATDMPSDAPTIFDENRSWSQNIENLTYLSRNCN